MPVTKKTDKVLFSLNGKKYSDRNFAAYIEENQKRTKNSDLKTFVNNYFKDFVYTTLSETEITNLEKTKPAFSYLLKEYHDGMLLFDLMKKEIWDKASEDTIGLKKYYNSNYDSLYSKQINYNISVFKYQKAKDAKKAINRLKTSRTKYTDSVLVQKMSKGDTLRFALIDAGNFTKGENIYADKIFNNPNKQNVIDFPKDNLIIAINDKKISKGKPFDEIRGIVISDYQNYLEKKWLSELKKKYPVTVNKEELNKIKTSFIKQ